MKKILGLLALCVLTLVACDDTPEPEPIVKAPIVTLDKEIVEATAEGGTFNVNYTIENAQEGVMLRVVEEVEWISDITVKSGVISFVVAANETTEERNATLNVEYTGAETHTIAVTQAAKREEPKPELICSVCGSSISEKVHAFSVDRFGKPMCYNCQKKGG